MLKFSFVAFCFLSLASVCNNKSSKILILYNSHSGLSPIYTSPQEFWRQEKKIDTITISDVSMLEEINTAFLKFENDENLDFSVHAVILNFRGSEIIDTFYTDKFFTHWLTGTKYLLDKEQRVKKTLNGLFSSGRD